MYARVCGSKLVRLRNILFPRPCKYECIKLHIIMYVSVCVGDCVCVCAREKERESARAEEQVKGERERQRARARQFGVASLKNRGGKYPDIHTRTNTHTRRLTFLKKKEKRTTTEYKDTPLPWRVRSADQVWRSTWSQLLPLAIPRQAAPLAKTPAAGRGTVKSHTFHEKLPCSLSKEPHTLWKGPYILSNKSYISRQAASHAKTPAAGRGTVKSHTFHQNSPIFYQKSLIFYQECPAFYKRAVYSTRWRRPIELSS